MDGIPRDVRYAIRTLSKSPGFTAVAIATLALGIGANTAIFSAVRAVLVRPLPFPDAARLVRITSDFHGLGVPDGGLSTVEMFDYRDRSGAFDRVCGLFPISANLTETDQPERVEALLVDVNYFSLLGVPAARGRVFGRPDFHTGIAPVAVISDSLWKRRYGGDTRVVGRPLRLDEDLYTIVGVLPAGFHHPGRGLQGEPEIFAPAGWKTSPFQAASRRAYFLAGALARLAPGVSPAVARERVAALAAGFRRDHPAEYPPREGWAPRVVPLQEDLVGRYRPALMILLGAVGLVLLIACANVANLLLARASAREREFAIRRALGASRMRLLRLLLVESVLLAGTGGAIGIVLCPFLVDLLGRWAPGGLAPSTDFRVDTAVLTFAALVSIGAGLLFGLLPGLQASEPALRAGLEETSRGASSSAARGRLRGALVVGEFSIALVLLVGAGLLVRSLARLRDVNPGFDASNVLTAGLWLPQPNEPSTGPYFRHARRAAAYSRMIDRMAALPGVVQAAGVSRLPLAGPPGFLTFVVEGRAATEDARSAIVSSASPGYFDVMGIPLRKGRAFRQADDEASVPVAVVSESLARREFPGGDAVGRRVRFLGALPPGTTAPWLTVIGVVGDVKADGLDAETRPQIYRCLLQSSNLGLALVLRTKGDPARLAASVAREVRAVDPGLPVYAVRPMAEIVSGAFAQRRSVLWLLGLFAAAAMALAAIGIYGVTANAIEQRTREIGIRVTLGAAPADVLRLLVGHGARLVGLGVGIGCAAALLATRVMRTLLFDVSARDPVVFVSIAALLATVALLACVVPARRAARLHPVDALRSP